MLMIICKLLKVGRAKQWGRGKLDLQCERVIVSSGLEWRILAAALLVTEDCHLPGRSY